MDVSTTTNILPHPDTPTSVMDLPPIPEKSPPRPPTPARQMGMSNECPVLPPFPTFDPSFFSVKVAGVAVGVNL